jgi:NADPH-dependent F420 reductase
MAAGPIFMSVRQPVAGRTNSGLDDIREALVSGRRRDDHQPERRAIEDPRLQRRHGHPANVLVVLGQRLDGVEQSPDAPAGGPRVGVNGIRRSKCPPVSPGECRRGHHPRQLATVSGLPTVNRRTVDRPDMRIALLGGTGDIGQGLALRWGRDTDHELLVGSRDPERARRRAEAYETELDGRGADAHLQGFENAMAADRADVVVLSVPAYHLVDTIEAVADRLDDETVLVTPAVGMKRDADGFHYNRPDAGSVAALAADAAPAAVPVVGAFHNLPADGLADLDREFEWDTLVFGEDADAKAAVADLADGIEGLRALDVGGLANAPEVEAVTPLLINVAMENDGLDDLGVRFE